MNPSAQTKIRRETVTLAVIAIVALSVRLFVSNTVPLSAPVSDMQDYWVRAVYIAAHGRIYDNSWRMPGYPVALATLFSLTGGPSLAAARALNAVLGAVAAVLTYCLARRSANALASMVAGLAIALYPSFIVYTTYIATEAVVAVPLLGALIAASFQSRRAAAVAGLCAGLTTLIRPAGIALLPAALLTMALRRTEDGGRKWSLVKPALVAFGFSVALAPWWAHNARLYSRFIPLDTTGGINLLIGANPFANGQWEWASVSRLHTEYLANVDTTTPQGSDTAAALARAFVAEHPSAAVKLMPAKLGALFALEGREHAYLYSFGYFGARDARTVRLWAVLILGTFPLIVLAAIGGCVVRDGIDSRVLAPSVVFLLTTAVMHLVSFGDPRFHLPFVPVLAVLGTGLAEWRRGVVRWRAAVALAIVLLLAVAWSGQLATYLAALVRLTAPGGWNSQLDFDALL